MSGKDYIIMGVLILIFGTIVFAFVMFLLHRWKKKI